MSLTSGNRTDEYYLGMAEYVSHASKDPSTKVGAVIVRPDGTIASTGYNGFPRGIDDSPHRLADRETKYALTVHAELNAILAAHERLDGCTIYLTHPPCAACSVCIIQAGIKNVKYKKPDQDLVSRWGPSLDRAFSVLTEAGVGLQDL